MIKEEKNYKNAIKIAEESVKNIEDIKLKITAFKVILEDILNNKENGKIERKESEAIGKKYNYTKHQKINSDNEEKRKLTEYFKVKSDELDLVYDVDSNRSIIVTCDFGNETGKSSQVQYVLLYLIANYILGGKRRCLTSEIIKKMKLFGFSELPNLNVYLRSVKPILVKVNVKKKKSENTFEITDLGISKACDLVREIIVNEGYIKQNPHSLPNKIRKNISQGKLALNIIDLISDGFFKAPKKIAEIKSKLEEKGIFYQREVIDEKMRRRFLGKELTRIKKDKIWGYVEKR